jgi:hypothetical protein
MSPKTPKSSPSWFTRNASSGRLGGLLPLGGTPASLRTPRPADEDEDSDSEGSGYGGAVWEDAASTGIEGNQAGSPQSPEEAMRPPSREASACYEPLLVRMCKDAVKLRFVSGLAAFEHRVRSIVYATHTHTHTHTHIYTHTHTHTHMHIHTYIYTCICIHTKRNLRIRASIQSSSFTPARFYRSSSRSTDPRTLPNDHSRNE